MRAKVGNALVMMGWGRDSEVADEQREGGAGRRSRKAS
jgi:hypothetical protein